MTAKLQAISSEILGSVTAGLTAPTPGLRGAFKSAMTRGLGRREAGRWMQRFHFDNLLGSALDN